MWIKICANTNLEDAQLAAKLGADAVGFVLAPSARRVTAAEVALHHASLSGTPLNVSEYSLPLRPRRLPKPPKKLD